MSCKKALNGLETSERKPSKGGVKIGSFCKDCLHYEACKAMDEEIDLTHLGLAKVCPRFKPKSRFVELPCEVGQTLYFLYDNRCANKPDQTPKILETQDWYFDIDKYGISILPRNVHGYKGVYHYYLNKTVFLSREEAEKDLKERESK